jgi:hypothetical protein
MPSVSKEEQFVDKGIKGLLHFADEINRGALELIGSVTGETKKKQGGSRTDQSLRHRRRHHSTPPAPAHATVHAQAQADVGYLQRRLELLELTPEQEAERTQRRRNDGLRSEMHNLAKSTHDQLQVLNNAVAEVANTVDKISNKQDSMEYTQGEILNGVDSIRSTLKKSLGSSRGCTQNRKILEALFLITASGTIGYFTFDMLNLYFQPHAFSLYTGISLSFITKCFNNLFNILFELTRHLIKIIIDLTKYVFGTSSIFLNTIPLYIGKALIAILLMILVLINVTLVFYIMCALGIKEKAISYLLFTICSYVRELFVFLTDKIPTSLSDLGPGGRLVDEMFKGLTGGKGFIESITSAFWYIINSIGTALGNLISESIKEQFGKMKFWGGGKKTTYSPRKEKDDWINPTVYLGLRRNKEAFEKIVTKGKKSKPKVNDLVYSFRNFDTVFTMIVMGIQPLTFIYQLVSTNKISKAETNLVKGFLKVALKRGSVNKGSVKKGSVKKGSVKKGSVNKGSVKKGSVNKGSLRKVKILSLKPTSTSTVSKVNKKTLMKTAAAAGGSRK